MDLKARLQTLQKEHPFVIISLLFAIIAIILLTTIIIVSSNSNDGIPGDSSESFDQSLQDDQAALSSIEEYGISKYLPIVSINPSYQITYNLTKDSDNNYHFKLILSAYSASARSAMVSRILTENFGSFDPLTYSIEIQNYYNPFSSYSLEDITNSILPPNIEKSNLYSYGESSYSVQTYIHTLYDGSTNTYRAVLENGSLKTTPQLFFTYQDLPFLERDAIKSINLLD